MPNPEDAVFVVVCNLPGCMPDDASLHRTKVGAEEYIRAEIADIEEVHGYTEGDPDPYVYDILPITWAEALRDGWKEEDLL